MKFFSKRPYARSAFFLLGVFYISNCVFGADDESEAKKSVVVPVVSSSVAMLYEKPTLSRSSVCSFIQYEKLGDLEKSTFLESCLVSLRRNPVGNKLVQQIEGISGEKNIVFREGSCGHAFCPPRIGSPEGSPLCVEIDFGKISPGSPFSCVGCLGPAAQADGPMTVFEVGSMIYPFHITLGHELIHLLHYLEDASLYLLRKNRFSDILWPILFNKREGFKREEILWQNLEEQRTVIGSQSNPLDPDREISEATLLLAEERSPRYAYHQHDDFFYERSEHIIEIFHRRGDGISGVWAGLTREDWRFDSTKALTSRLNSDFFKQAHREDYDRAESILDVGDICPGGELRSTLPRALQEKLARRKALLESKKEQRVKAEEKQEK